MSTLAIAPAASPSVWDFLFERLCWLTFDHLGENRVAVVRQSVNLRVADVWLQRHDLLLELFGEENLAGFDNATRADGAVAGDVPVCVHLHVDVDASVDVEAWED